MDFSALKIDINLGLKHFKWKKIKYLHSNLENEAF